MKNIRVIGGYKCGCTYGPVWQKDRLEYCGVHGDEIANEYDVSFMSAPNKVLHTDAAMPPSAEQDSSSESVPAVESDTQPRR